MNRIKELENKIADFCEQDKFNDDLYTKLSDELQEIDPYNDMSCPSWPNCDIGGSGWLY